MKDIKDKEFKGKEVAFEFDGSEYSGLVVELSELTPEEVRVALNRIPSQYAHWASLSADVKHKAKLLDTKYELWFAEKYDLVDSVDPKKTEGWKKNQVMLENVDEYKKIMKAKHKLSLVQSKVAVLVEAYSMQSRTLQSIGSLLRAEIEMYDRE